MIDKILASVAREFGVEIAVAVSSLIWAGVAAHKVGQTAVQVRATYGTENAVKVLHLVQ